MGAVVAGIYNLAVKEEVAYQVNLEGTRHVLRFCQACGEEIGEQRLIARIVATHCIDCKTEAEQLERRAQVF